MKTIKLTQQLETIVDDNVYGLISGYSWVAQYSPNIKKYYARREVSLNGIRHVIYLHRLIAGVPNKFRVKHLNKRTLDNRYRNFQLLDKHKNIYKFHNFRGKSYFKGVKWSAYYGLWMAEIYGLPVGYYRYEIDAAKAYNIKLAEILKIRCVDPVYYNDKRFNNIRINSVAQKSD